MSDGKEAMRNQPSGFFLYGSASAVIYFVATTLGLLLEIPLDPPVFLFWPAAGVGFTLVFFFGLPAIFGVWIGASLASFVAFAIVHTHTGGVYHSFVQSAVFGAISVLQYAVGVFALHRVCGNRIPFYRIKDLAAFVFLGVGLPAVVASGIGILALYGFSMIEARHLVEGWIILISGKMVSIFVIAPLLICARELRNTRFHLPHARQFAAYLVLLTIFCICTFIRVDQFPVSQYLVPYLVIPFLIWSGMRWRLAGVMGTLFFVLVACSIGAKMGRGPFASSSALWMAIQLQLFIGTMSIGALTEMATYYEWKATEEVLRSSRDELEIKVLERTEALRESEKRYREVAEERARLLDAERRGRKEAERVTYAKDVFLATLSHELRTPLSSILAWAQLLRTQKVPPDKWRAGLEIIEKSARAQAQLIGDMLDFSRIILGKLKIVPAPAALTQVIEDAVKLLRSEAEKKGLRVEVDLSPATGWAIVDRARLQQVFINLIGNSIKFTPSPGVIRVSSWQEHESIFVRVEDTGKGIEKELLPHIFGRFTQGRQSNHSQGGLGLGLAIVHQLVQMHGGRVKASSPGPGKGSVFLVQLPACMDQCHSVELTGTLVNRHVLLVDEKPDHLEAIQLILEQKGAIVHTVENHDEARECMNRHFPDVMLVDLNLGAGTEAFRVVQTARQLEKESPSRARVLAVAYCEFEDQWARERALRAGYDLKWRKPISPDRVLWVMQQKRELKNRRIA